MKFLCRTLEFKIEEIRGTKNLMPFIRQIIADSEIRNGMGMIQVKHSTSALISQEDEEGLLKKDLPELLDYLVPKGFGSNHDDLSQRPNISPEERMNGRAHLEHILVGHDSKPFIIENGEIDLGEWLSVLLIDFDPIGREPRKVKIAVMGE